MISIKYKQKIHYISYIHYKYDYAYVYTIGMLHEGAEQRSVLHEAGQT